MRIVKDFKTCWLQCLCDLILCQSMVVFASLMLDSLFASWHLPLASWTERSPCFCGSAADGQQQLPYVASAIDTARNVLLISRRVLCNWGFQLGAVRQDCIQNGQNCSPFTIAGRGMFATFGSEEGKTISLCLFIHAHCHLVTSLYCCHQNSQVQSI